jgi:hypothetical protein
VATEGQRRAVERQIERARSSLAACEDAGGDPETISRARATLVAAYAVRARDARCGAGQLSLGSQRAPSVDACDDGWRRVEEIVAEAEAAACQAMRLARMVDRQPAWKAARAAEAAARDARRLVTERNHAYTFHADPRFSFGEGWHLAAAAVLAGVAIQIEPGKPQTAQVERFLHDAGLSSRLQPYRSRPRSSKQLTAIVAQGFRASPLEARRKLREAFLGPAPISPAVAEWTDRRLAGTAGARTKKVLLWVRQGAHQAARNSTHPELVELARRTLVLGLTPVLIGDAVQGGDVPPGAVDLTSFFRDPIFQGLTTRRAQLQMFEHLRESHGLVGQLGVTTAGMDGPALMGLPTAYLTAAPNPRMRAWVGTVPGYQEIVRDEGYTERVDETLRRWFPAGSS